MRYVLAFFVSLSLFFIALGYEMHDDGQNKQIPVAAGNWEHTHGYSDYQDFTTKNPIGGQNNGR